MLENYHNPDLVLGRRRVKGTVCWKSPSNIALIKYWGKYNNQLPKNPSLSFSLKECYTQTSLSYQTSNSKPKRKFFFNGEENEKFAQRIWSLLVTFSSFYPFLSQIDIKIDTKNSFPHSAGIASSASAMSALALCLVDMEQKIFGQKLKEDEFFLKASYLARLGSGSASRSVYKGYSIWGNTKEVDASSDIYAIAYNKNIHRNFLGLKDAILIVNADEKSVSSSAGHRLMDTHFYAKSRMYQAAINIKTLIKVLDNGDYNTFAEIVENEALSLHALMMSAKPGYMLMKGASIAIIEKVRAYRKKTNDFLCFTLDAGPNVHLIYHPNNQENIEKFILKELQALCHQSQIIWDQMGEGPKRIQQ